MGYHSFSNKKLPAQAVFCSMIGTTLKRPEVLEKSIDQDVPNYQQAHPDDRPMEDGRFESEHKGQVFGSPLEV